MCDVAIVVIATNYLCSVYCVSAQVAGNQVNLLESELLYLFGLQVMTSLISAAGYFEILASRCCI